jgi:hypothetical protein
VILAGYSSESVIDNYDTLAHAIRSKQAKKRYFYADIYMTYEVVVL